MAAAAAAAAAKSLQSCPTLRDPMDCSPPGPSVRGILQARVLEWIAVSSSRKAWSLRVVCTPTFTMTKIQVSLNGLMNKQNVVYTYDGILVILKKGRKF